MRHLWQFLLICGIWGFGLADNCLSDDAPGAADGAKESKVSIFIDCSFCDQDYFRTEIPFFNFVRDRLAADVHILISQQSTGGGGIEYSLEFIGQHRFAGITDTLQYYSYQSDTEDKIRAGIARTIELGLVRFVARTPLSEGLIIQYRKPSTPIIRKDKWNHWVFSIESNISASGEHNKKAFYIDGDIEAMRTTEQSIIWIEAYNSYEQNRYEGIGLGLSRSRSAEAGIVWSVGAHWGVGAWSELNASTYFNKKLQWLTGTAVEYNIYPYSESTRRQFRISYDIETTDNQYEEETVFGKVREWLVQEKVSCDVKIIKPWGTITASSYAGNYFHDLKKYHFYLSSELSLRLIEGLSLELSGGGSWYNDQLSLRRSEASAEQIIAGRRELPTTYDYWTKIGIKYTFGSIYNNIVNARFGF